MTVEQNVRGKCGLEDPTLSTRSIPQMSVLDDSQPPIAAHRSNDQNEMASMSLAVNCEMTDHEPRPRSVNGISEFPENDIVSEANTIMRQYGMDPDYMVFPGEDESIC